MTMSIKTHHELWPSSGRLLMYSKKRVRPRMEPWWTQALTGYSCKDFPFRATQSRLLLRKDKISPINRPELYKTWVCEEDQHAKPGRNL